mgnify:CR=1 FL=1
MQHQTMLIAAIALGGFLSLYNSVAMNIALPTFLRVFDTDLATIQWIMIGYSLMMGVRSPTAGYFTDKISCRNLFAYSMVGFAVMALLSGFCNNIYNAEGGTHLTGFKTVFTNVINTYARELNILKEKDVNFTGADVRNGMTAIVSVKHPDPRFEGQTKTKLDNQDANRATAKVTSDEVPLYFDKNLETLKTVISCAEKAAKIRKAEEKARTNLLTKQKFSFDSNGKLANCESRDASKCEIFIVEGDSAGGSAKMARNRMYQAIMPIRGKILNVEKASIDKVLANAEIKTMINALIIFFINFSLFLYFLNPISLYKIKHTIQGLNFFFL